MTLDWLQELRHCCHSEDAFQAALKLIAKAGVAVYDSDTESSALSAVPPRVTRERLQNNHTFISEVLHTQSGLVVVVDRDTRIVLFSHACEKMSGYVAAEVFEKTFWEVFQPDVGEDKLNRWFTEVIEQKSPAKTKHKIRRKSGKYRFVEWDVTVMLDSSGEVEYIVVTGIDVTDRTIVEEVMELLSSAVEYTSETILIGKFDKKDALPIIQFINTSGCRLTGFDEAEIIGNRLNIFFGESNHVAALQESLSRVKLGESVSIEAEIHCKDNRVIVATGAISPVIDDSKQVTNFVAVFHDVTEQRQLEKELLEREQLYRTLVELSSTAIVVHSGGKILFANQYGTQQVGAKNPEELIGRSVLQFVHPTSLPTVVERIKTMVEKGESVPLLEEVFQKLDGTPFHVETAASPILFQGKPAILTVVRDISDRIQQQNALRESEQRLNLALQGANQGVWDWNVKTGEVFNIGCAEILKYTEDEYEQLGGRWRKFVHPDDLPQLHRKFSEHIRGLTPHYECEYRVLDRSGEWRWVLANGQAVEWDEAGNPVRIAGTRIDITRLKVTEEALQQSSEKFRSLFDSANDAILIMDRYQLTDVNPKAQEIFGYTRDEVIGKTHWDLSPITQPDGKLSREYGMQLIDECLAGKKFIFEWQHTRKDGTLFDAEVSLSRVLLKGTTYLQAIVRDITEWKTAITELKESEHRYRSIVNAIGDYSYILKVSSDDSVMFEWTSDTVLAIMSPGSDGADFKRFREIVHPEDVSGFAAKLALRKSGVTCSGEYRVVLPGNDIRWLRDIGVPVKNARTGTVERIYCAAHDITDQMNLWKKISESEQRYRRLFEESPIGLWEFECSEVTEYLSGVLDILPEKLALNSIVFQEKIVSHLRRLKVLDINNAACAFFRAPDKEGLFRNYTDILSTMNFELNRSDIIEFFAGKYHMEFESTIRTPWFPEEIHAQVTINLLDKNRLLVGFVDITELKHALSQIKESEEKFSLVFHSTPDVYTVTTLNEGRFVEINDTFSTVTGYTREEAIGNTSLDLKIWRNIDQRQAIVTRLQKNRALQNIEIQLQMKSGELRDFIYSAKVIQLANNEYLLSLFHDITERKHSERVAIEATARFQWVVENAPAVAIQGISPDGIVVRWNQYCEKLYGYSEKEAVGRKLGELILAEEDETAFETMLKNILRTGESSEPQAWQVYDRNRKKLWVLSSIFPILVDDEVLEIFCMDVDITDIKHAEEEIREREERYRTLATTINDILLEIDANGVFQFVSPNVTRILGYEQDELTGKMFFAFVTSPEVQLQKTIFEQFILTGKPESMEMTIRHKNGEKIIFEVAAKLFTRPDSDLRIVAVAREITDRKRLEEERLRSQKLESLGILAGGIAHDFNNLLTGIVGSISFAKLFPDSREDSAKLLEEAERTALRAKDLTHQLLTFAKGGEPIRKTADLAKIIRDTVSFSLRGSKSTSEIELPGDLAAVDVDEGQIGQVFQNLVINASQAMPGGGKVRITGRNLTFGDPLPSQLTPGDYVAILVSDNGIGIKEEHLSRIFDPYFTTKQSGSGLGLASVHSILMRHDGWVSVESSVGFGTTFTIYLPASKTKHTSTVAVEDKVECGKGRVLVLDDEEIIRTLLKRILEHLGYEAVTTGEGSETIEAYQSAIAEKKPFDLVIMDLTIPGGMGGVETINKLSQIDPQVKAIVSSGYSNDPVMANYRKYGFSGVVAKPYVLKEISQVVREVLHSQIPVS
ncbi:MAG: PAS domain S-box protein [bacterium]|nr:PAS domain S-box protein [bacterium]